MMRSALPSRRWLAIVVAGVFLYGMTGPASRAAAQDLGRVTGTVSDTAGNPLMGATVLLAGPELGATETFGSLIERVSTDAQGRFSIEHLAPGWYSLRVIAATRVPAMRDRVRVAAGETTQQKFVLGDFFSPLRLQNRKPDFSTWDNEWKWILRASDSTRPVLRFHPVEQASSGEPKAAVPGRERVMGVMPGSPDAISEDQGMRSVLAYLSPLSPDSDLLVAGSLDSVGLRGSSLVASMRKELNSGAPEELSLVFQNLGFGSDGDFLAPSGPDPLENAQGVSITFVHTTRISNSLSLTAGVEANYLKARSDAKTISPRLTAEYQATSSTKVAFNYGAPPEDQGQTVMDRVGALERFPRVSLEGSRLRLENIQHVELYVQHQLDPVSRVELAVYRDSFHNSVILGLGRPNEWAGTDEGLLPTTDGSGVGLTAGNYTSQGFRADYKRQIGQNVEVVVAYTYGDALALEGGLLGNPAPANDFSSTRIAKYLHPQHTGVIASRISARIPSCHTEIVTSYTWIPPGRVTVVDPYDLASMDLTPFLGIEIRQPLPSVAFLPAHFEALADFRNLLGQGSVTMTEPDGNPVVLTSSYRTLRGGFSVRF